MKKNNVAAVLAVNVVVLGVIALNAYKPELEKIAEDFVKLKKTKKKNSKAYQLEKKKILKLAEKAVPEPEKLIEESLTKCELIAVKNTDLISTEVNEFLMKKFELLPLDVFENNTRALSLANISVEDTVRTVPALEGPVASPISTLSTITDMTDVPTREKFFRGSLMSIALIIVLNSIGLKNLVDSVKNIDFSKEAIEETIEDIEDFFVDTYDVVVTFNNHDEIVDRKVNRIMALDETIEQKLIDIFNLEQLSKDEKISNIIALDDVDYNAKFDFFLNAFDESEAIQIIIGSNLTTFVNVADYIMNIESLSEETKVDYIMNSDLTGYIRIFDYVLSCPEINESYRMEYVLNSSIADYDEKFDYFMKKDTSFYDKVWTVLQIPGVEFDTVFNDLLSVDEVTQDELITTLMQTDLVSFNKLFENIFKFNNIESEKIIDYMVYFNDYCNTGYNTVELNDLVTYGLNIPTFSREEKVECFWGLLDNMTLEEKEAFIQNYYNIDVKGYLNIRLSSKDDITEEKQILLDLYEKINNSKIEYILEHYGMTSEQLNIVTAGCAAEGYIDYDDIYWVANTIFNRITHPWYTRKGINPYIQFIAPKQFSVYGDGSYLKYLNPSDWDHLKKRIIADQAVIDMLYLGYDGIQHDYYEFRSWGITDFSNVYVVEHGNRYAKVLSDDERVMYDFLDASTRNTTEQKVLELTLK